MISIATYNVLADAYIRREYYPRTDPALLRPGARDDALVARFGGFDADVICLQEVEQRLMDRIGLPGKFVHKAGGKPDGCATFVRGEGRHEAVHFDDGTGHLVLITETAGITIANTHIKWDAKWGVGQAEAIVRALAPHPRPWIVCGDFNAEPESSVLRVFRDFVDAHPASVFTCNSNGRAKKIDYILATKELTAEPLPSGIVTDDTPLPSSSEPSDHIPLRAICR
jgi:endonuclease/exonuclease/phosphatase family metal-dependent hydrolase